jgi:hypothetical protein
MGIPAKPVAGLFDVFGAYLEAIPVLAAFA